MAEISSASIFGTRVDLADMQAIRDRIDTALSTGEHITIAYSHFWTLLRARRDSAVRELLNATTINHIDGIGVQLAVQFLYGANPGRLTGSDFLSPWLEDSLREGRRIFILGGFLNTAEHLHIVIRERYPGRALLHHHGEIAADDRSIADAIRNAHPDILLVCLGDPLQFEWISRYRETLEIPVVIAAGGYVDFLAGTRPRAPRWMRRIGLEWLHRLLHEPRRLWRRYLLGIPAFVFLVLREKLRSSR